MGRERQGHSRGQLSRVLRALEGNFLGGRSLVPYLGVILLINVSYIWQYVYSKWMPLKSKA